MKKLSLLENVRGFHTGAYTLFALQLIAHMSVIPMFFFARFSDYLVSFFVYFLTGCLGMTMTYHRLLSHRSWQAPKFIECLFSIFAGIGLTGSAISWVAVHRKHHRYMDMPNDPHSPAHKGWFYSHFLSMFSSVELKYVTDLVRDPFYRFQHTYYLSINFVWAFLAVLVFGEPMAIVYAWLFPAALLWNAGSMIVSYSHRNFDVQNDTWLSILVWGEGYHRSHHENPKAVRFGFFDLGGILAGKIDWFRRGRE